MDFQNAIKFFRELKKNNTREWFNSNRDGWEKVKNEFVSFTGLLIQEITSFDPSIGPLEPKQCIFRLNRDVRFSADKSPYKTHTGAYIAEGGRKSVKAGYYFHLDPSGSFLGGGIWMPASEVLARLREEIDYCGEEFEGIVSAPGFKKYFSTLHGERLKTAPKGYSVDHPHIDYLRLKSFTVDFNLDEKNLSRPDLIKSCGAAFRQMKPLVEFFNRTFDQ